MATLGPEARKALQLLREHKAVLEVKYNWYEIRVKFITGIRENWILHERPNKRREFRTLFPKNGPWWGKRQIPTFCEFQSEPFNDEHNEIIEPHFKVQYLNIRRSGFINTRIKLHEITQQLYEEGWVEPRYPKRALQEDFYNISKNNLDNAVISLNYVNAYPATSTRQPGAVILSHFVPDWGDVEDPYRKPLRTAWGKKTAIYRALMEMLKGKKDLTRTELIRALMAFPSQKYGPRFVSPLFYRALIERIFKIENPVILDPTPTHGSLAMALGVKGGTMLHEPCKRFSSFSQGLAEFLKIEIREYAGEQVDAVMFGTLQKMSLEEVQAAVKKYKGKAKHILCPVDKMDRDRIAAATNPKRIIKALINSLKDGEDCILIY